MWLFGTAFLFVYFLDSLIQGRGAFHLPANSLILETGGYKGRSRAIPRQELHRLMCDLFGVLPHQILCEYGMCELSSQAYSRLGHDVSCETARFFQFPPWARARVISPETGLEVAEGETGLLRIFDLANAWSVCAIQTEDLAVRCGTAFELIGRAHAAEPRGCSLLATS